MNKSAGKQGLMPAPAVMLLLSLLLGGCCEKSDLDFERFDGFIDGVGDIHAGFEFDWLSGDTTFSLDFWSGIDAFSSIDIFAVLGLNLNFGVNATFEIGSISWDVDKDAYREPVRVLQVTNSDTGEQFRFFQWTGDKYTLDRGQSYMGFVYGGSTVIVAANNADSKGVVIVSATGTADAELGILACTDSYQCGVCGKKDKVSSCIEYAAEGNFSAVVASSQATDTSSQSDSDSTSGIPDSDTMSDTATTTDAVVDSGTTFDTAVDTDTATSTTVDSATGGNTDTGSGFSLDLDSDSSADISITFDSDTLSIDWGF